MIFEVHAERLLVISDLHLGNPSSTARERLVEFLEEARAGGWDVCINGDGFDLLQSRARRLASEAVTVMSAIARHMDAGRRAYYVVGNHDIQLEHFLGAGSSRRSCRSSTCARATSASASSTATSTTRGTPAPRAATRC